ncbi:stage III sporulation protein AG [Aquibacillus sp. 3ASR75-11]|uniref:Stage III sporulation protein AG n=1 Tax=Terrihalobacillus insolitus TaxID=2950438 RepID=A0A9X3WUZ1_9BACI|nr:stage III sporulation protein AG [Terrihalobacillus insolitus]MDC3414428.1 stage III sporulation protein AG [Terrihalobacillus insolitus]MDC3425308.1 stage III sporulation protein AG [Terrihalobacillus insolitus]
MKNPLKNWLSSIHFKQDDTNKSNKVGYILIIALTGVLLLIVSNIFQPSKEEAAPPLPSENESKDIQGEKETILQKDDNKSEFVKSIESQYEKDLETLLNKIQGISDADVMVNLDSTKQKIYEKNLILGQQSTEETDKNGGERIVEDVTKEQQVVLVRQGDKEVPLLVQTKKPEVRGVLVVAKGVENIQIKKWVIDAVSRVLDVPTNQISVMPKN